jgi:hypothetical protein
MPDAGTASEHAVTKAFTGRLLGGANRTAPSATVTALSVIGTAPLATGISQIKE